MSDLKKLVHVENWRLSQMAMLVLMFMSLIASIISGPTTGTVNVMITVVASLAYSFLLVFGNFYEKIRLPQIVKITLLVIEIVESAIHNGQTYQTCPLEMISSIVIDLFILVEGGFFA